MSQDGIASHLLNGNGEPLIRHNDLAIEMARGGDVQHELLQALPVAVYTTDAAGHITFFNEAAAALWGCRPKLNSDQWCGSWRMYWPDGTPLPHNACPMAVALKEKRDFAGNGQEAVAERPDGTRIPFMAFPSLLRDAAGEVVGALNMFVDISERKRNEEIAQRLASIVESSDDAIIGKNFDGIITSWNKSAERLFGYVADEAIGKPVTILIPANRQDEEEAILKRIRSGQRVEHFETVRQRKDGSLIDISLTISPIRNSFGKIIGASKIARDITEARRAAAELKEQKEIIETIQGLGQLLSGELELQKLVQAVTDAATELTGAGFGSRLAVPQRYRVCEDLLPRNRTGQDCNDLSGHFRFRRRWTHKPQPFDGCGRPGRLCAEFVYRGARGVGRQAWIDATGDSVQSGAKSPLGQSRIYTLDQRRSAGARLAAVSSPL